MLRATHGDDLKIGSRTVVRASRLMAVMQRPVPGTKIVRACIVRHLLLAVRQSTCQLYFYKMRSRRVENIFVFIIRGGGKRLSVLVLLSKYKQPHENDTRQTSQPVHHLSHSRPQNPRLHQRPPAAPPGPRHGQPPAPPFSCSSREMSSVTKSTLSSVLDYGPTYLSRSLA